MLPNFVWCNFIRRKSQCVFVHEVFSAGCVVYLVSSGCALSIENLLGFFDAQCGGARNLPTMFDLMAHAMAQI